MAKRDINLFKAAGGERAKAGKRSPMSMMLVLGLVLVVAALGVAAYFNMKVNTAKNDYEKKQTIGSNYDRTINSSAVNQLSAEFNKVKNDIDAAAAINAYVETRSALYPTAKPDEVEAVKATIIDNPLGEMFDLNEPDEEEGGSFTPRDYNAIRASFYSDEAEDFADKELFYYALQKLADKQEADTEVNVWYDYYRCYFVTVFTGGDGLGITRLISALASTNGTMNGQTPFSRLIMPNDIYDDGVYIPAKYHTFIFEDETYNVLLLPMKSVVERAFDVLEAHANALVEQNDTMGQMELARYGVKDIEFTNSTLSFKLVLSSNDTALYTGFLDELDASYFFDVGDDVIIMDGDPTSGGYEFPVTLKYKNRPVIETVEE